MVDVAAHDFPTASEVLVSFPEAWELVDKLDTEAGLLYIACFPIERSRPTRNHFAGLTPEINVSLVFYGLYKFFQPWPMPTVRVKWDPRAGSGRVIGMGESKLQLQPVGQAQAWFGLTDAVIWECYAHELWRGSGGEQTLTKLWGKVEEDVRSPKLWTLPHEPTFEQGYTEFLAGIGYAQDAQCPDWWSRVVKTKPQRVVLVPSD